MKIKITASPVFTMVVPPATVALLIEMSRHHYDGRCKQASTLGGFLFGWKNYTDFDPESTVSATLDQLDTALKICENTGIFPLTKDHKTLDTVRRFATDIRRAVDHWNLIRPEWVAGIDTAPKMAA